jgi:rhodanese-related sulfurtransferase
MQQARHYIAFGTDRDRNMTGIARVDPLQADAAISTQPNAVLIDVRSRVEFDYVGHPPGALHVAWKEFPDWQVNPRFVDEVRSALKARGLAEPESAPLYLLCRSGARSMAAAEELQRHGFRNLHNVEEGFEGDRDNDNHRGTISGWRFRGLPWEQG